MSLKKLIMQQLHDESLWAEPQTAQEVYIREALKHLLTEIMKAHLSQTKGEKQ